MMETDAIMALPVRKVCTPATTLYLWVPHALIKEGFLVMEAWGFRDSHSEIVWDKRGKGGGGVGHYARMVHEHLLIGVGPESPTWDGTIPSIISAPRGKHSEKPDIFYKTIEKAVGGPYLEMFGRKERDGWTVCGDQVTDRCEVVAGAVAPA